MVAGQSVVMECMAAADPTPFVSWIRQGEYEGQDYIFVVHRNLWILHSKNLEKVEKSGTGRVLVTSILNDRGVSQCGVSLLKWNY